MLSRRLVGSSLAAAAVWVLDRGTKTAAVHHLDGPQSLPVIEPWLWLTLHHNTGAAFGLGAGLPGGLTLFATALTLALFVWWARSVSSRPARAWTEVYGLALILGGSAGNLTDRYAQGAVIDFIDLRVWPIFNAADIAITAGALLWAAGTFVSARGRAA